MIDDYMSTGMKITLYKEGSVPQTVVPVDTEPDDPDVTEPDPTGWEAAVQNVWNGKRYFGYFG